MADPVTVVVSRRVQRGREADFETLSTAMTERASAFPGYLGATMFRPAAAEDPEYRIVFKFRDRETLAAWESSAERAELLGEIEALLQEPSEREVLSGIVTWFTLPGQNPVQPPPRYKMTLVSWLALYPAVTLVFLLFGDPEGNGRYYGSDVRRDLFFQSRIYARHTRRVHLLIRLI